MAAAGSAAFGGRLAAAGSVAFAGRFGAAGSKAFAFAFAFDFGAGFVVFCWAMAGVSSCLTRWARVPAVPGSPGHPCARAGPRHPGDGRTGDGFPPAPAPRRRCGGRRAGQVAAP
ncbi:hypothetical protein GCM10010371_23440 [Streptomyces subrutilus]|uniref:Uncharacterized protein n=1 Tax=Streptomyces subrutilus TaxID=36818 RepID=A0A918V331_9ACTN|nr:hypothetical protein GCM10010371_23440 [Streptomyces subrutilus]